MKKLIAILTLALMLFGMTGCDLFEAQEKTFKKGDHFKITLTEDFEKIKEGKYEEYEGFYTSYESTYVHVLVRRELYEDFEDGTTLDEYIELVLEANDMPGKAVKKGEGYKFITYNNVEDGENIFYKVCFYEGYDGFFAVSFVVNLDNLDKFGTSIEKWAESVDVD